MHLNVPNLQKQQDDELLICLMSFYILQRNSYSVKYKTGKAFTTITVIEHTAISSNGTCV